MLYLCATIKLFRSPHSQHISAPPIDYETHEAWDPKVVDNLGRNRVDQELLLFCASSPSIRTVPAILQDVFPEKSSKPNCTRTHNTAPESGKNLASEHVKLLTSEG